NPHLCRASASPPLVAPSHPPGARLSWIEDTSAEKHRVCFPVPNEENEGMVGFEDFRLRRAATQARAEYHPHSGCRCCLGACLVDLHERLVDDLGNLQCFIPDPTEIGVIAESQISVQSAQVELQVEFRLDLETREGDDDRLRIESV